MDEHPGDTLGNRFLTFWGALGAIAALALIVGVYRWIAVPSAGTVNDGGVGNARRATLSQVNAEERKEFTAVAEVEAGKTVRLPADLLIPYAAKTLGGQKPAPSAVKTPQALQREAASTHDPNVSAFEGK